MKRLHIFQAGRRTAMSGQTLDFSEADLAASAAAYDPKLHEAPLVVGHPKTDDPAQGWVSGLVAEAGGLFANPRAVDIQFAEAVKAERYKKISAAFYPPDHPSNPVPGVYYLRHVGFLGGQAPAVKGLAPIEFADDGENLVEIEFAEFGDWTDGAVGRALRGLREWVISKFGIEEADKALPGWTADALIEAAVTPPTSLNATAYSEGNPTAALESNTMTPEQIRDAQKKLDDAKAAQDAEFAERESGLKEREARLARQDSVEFAEVLVSEGRLPPAQKARVVELLFAAGTSAVALEFAEGDQTIKAPQVDALKDLLKALPVQIEYAELAPKTKAAKVDGTDAQALATAALEFVESERGKGRVISVAQAMDHITTQAER